MGTHPIFESDFDCLTVMTRLLHVRRTVLRNRSLAIQRNTVRPDGFVGQLHRAILASLEEKNDYNRLYPIASYYFDGQGKSVRPQIVRVVSEALTGEMDEKSFKVGMIAEMIHTASLIHDDVIDKSDMRRGKAAANVKWGVTPAVMAGNYIIAASSQLLASLGDNEATIVISKIIEDLIHGELCQMESIQSTHDERYKQYIRKTYLKTASLIANSCDAVAHLSGCSQEQRKAARDFGKFIGLAFQVQDDRLDFIADAAQLGKPACADLRLGLSTAPVLFACEFNEAEMHPLMARRFAKAGDVEKAFDIIINKSDAMLRTRLLAEQYAKEAESLIDVMTTATSSREQLRQLTHMVTHRDK